MSNIAVRPLNTDELDLIESLLSLSVSGDNQGIAKIGSTTFENVTFSGGGGTPVSSLNGLTGDVTLSAGTNITLTPAGNTITIASTGGLSESFETVSKNLKAYPYTITYSGGDIDTITYDLGGGMSIIKTFGYTSGDVTSITLSGDTPSGIDLVKTISYVGGVVDNIVYS